jgi:hypothetical protein
LVAKVAAFTGNPQAVSAAAAWFRVNSASGLSGTCDDFDAAAIVESSLICSPMLQFAWREWPRFGQGDNQKSPERRSRAQTYKQMIVLMYY